MRGAVQRGQDPGFLHLYIGEEAVAVGTMQALTPDDAIVATNVPARTVDGMDVAAVEAAAREAADFVRSGNGPFLLECRTYRFRAHSMFDPELYRDKGEVEQWKTRDPILLVRRRLEEDGAGAASLAALEAAVDQEIAAAVDFAEAGTWEPVGDLLKDVYTR